MRVRCLDYPGGTNRNLLETRHLQDAVGHLSGTSWLDDFGGNIVLAGHVENASGEPGPFAHLFTAHLNARVVLRDGTRGEHYRVTAIETAAPNALQYVAQDGRRRPPDHLYGLGFEKQKPTWAA